MWSEKPISRKWISADHLHEETTLTREHSLLKRTYNRTINSSLILQNQALDKSVKANVTQINVSHSGQQWIKQKYENNSIFHSKLWSKGIFHSFLFHHLPPSCFYSSLLEIFSPNQPTRNQHKDHPGSALGWQWINSALLLFLQRFLMVTLGT